MLKMENNVQDMWWASISVSAQEAKSLQNWINAGIEGTRYTNDRTTIAKNRSYRLLKVITKKWRLYKKEKNKREQQIVARPIPMEICSDPKDRRRFPPKIMQEHYVIEKHNSALDVSTDYNWILNRWNQIIQEGRHPKENRF